MQPDQNQETRRAAYGLTTGPSQKQDGQCLRR